jgi:radical SAM protein with 4Fe4S-binding SPASM domain
MGMKCNPGFNEVKFTKEEWGNDYRNYRSEWSSNARENIVRKFPLHIDLEVTNRCNLRCPFCVREFMEKGGVGDMAMPLAMRIIKECQGSVPSIKFNWRGEPTMYKGLPMLVQMAKSNGFMETHINTNGTLLDRDEFVALADAGLDRLIISVDSFKRKHYEEQRVGAKYENVMANIKRAVAIKKEMGWTRPYIRVQKVNLPGYEDENKKYIEFFKKMGVDSAAINTYKEKNVGLVDWEPLQCVQPWQRLVVAWDGKYYPCCQGHNFNPIGSAMDGMSVRQAWASPLMETLRDLHSRNLQKDIPQCRECETTKPE